MLQQRVIHSDDKRCNVNADTCRRRGALSSGDGRYRVRFAMSSHVRRTYTLLAAAESRAARIHIAAAARIEMAGVLDTVGRFSSLSWRARGSCGSVYGRTPDWAVQTPLLSR
jgi:hypothetical protein